MKILRVISLLSLIFFSGSAISQDPAPNLTPEEIRSARLDLLKVLQEGVLKIQPARISIIDAYMEAKIYHWPPPEGAYIFPQMLRLFAEQGKLFSRNLCDVTKEYPDTMIGTVYVEYHTILEYEEGKDLVTRLEFKESTECIPGLETLFQRMKRKALDSMKNKKKNR